MTDNQVDNAHAQMSRRTHLLGKGAFPIHRDESKRAARTGSTKKSSVSTQKAKSSPADHKCSVCLELFTEPKILPCCHTFCLECLKKTARTVGQITCPKCRQSHPIPAGGLSEFLTDFVTTYELEVASISTKERKDLVCGECEQPAPVTHFCSDCQNDECGLQLHKRLKTFRGHNVVPISQVSAAALCQTQYCGLHKGESLKLYCETCKELVCRDCTLVDHREHSYKFVQDARKQVESDMVCLRSEVAEKLSVFKPDLAEIKMVETAVVGHPEVLKADINLFFDNLVKSIEARRSALIQEAEAVCQKDLKQVWADKEYHETMLAHISAVFGLVEKAMRCISDSEMILTALQSIRQLRMIKEREWDARAFVKMVASVPSFKKENVAVDSFGGIVRVVTPTKGIQVTNPTQSQNLYNHLVISVTCSPDNVESLIDGRSKRNVNVRKAAKFEELEVVVLYGKSKKELDKRCITIQRVQTPDIPPILGIKTQSRAASLVAPTNTYTFQATIRLVCSGTHQVIFRYGYGETTHTFTVQGQPQNGARVRKGPDWGPETERRVQQNRAGGKQGFHQTDYNPASAEIGSVYNKHRHNLSLDVSGWLTVSADWVGRLQYKWGVDEEYELELCM